MKNAFVLLAIVGVTSVASASTLREHVVADLHKATPQGVASFSRDLAFGLNELRRCSPEVQLQLDFGQQLVAVTYADSRNGVRISTITANGVRPMPSGQPYQVTLTVSSRPIVDRNPPLDAPGRRAYSCRVEHAEPPQN